MRFWKSSFAVFVVGAALATGAAPARADGALGIYFDTAGQQCSGQIPTASFVTLHVLLTPAGSTYGGIQGAEFRIELPADGGCLFQNVSAPPASLGDPFGDGILMGFANCLGSARPEVMSFTALASGAATSDAVLSIRPKRSGPTIFGCPVVVLCDAPTFTAVCVEGESAVLNPSGARPCGSSRVDSQWSRVKDLYRP